MKQALYRKYRPTKLSELVGQEEAVSLINNQIDNENLGQVFISDTHEDRIKTALEMTTSDYEIFNLS